MRYFDKTFPEMISKYGFKCSFNPTFKVASDKGWISKGYYGLDQGPIVLMVENYCSEFLWRLMRRSPYIVTGLRRAGFAGGWLRHAPQPLRESSGVAKTVARQGAIGMATETKTRLS